MANIFRLRFIWITGFMSMLSAVLAGPAAHGAAVCKRQALQLPITMAGTRPLFAAKINDQEVHFILDSGAFWSMISGAAAEEFKLKTHPAPYGLTVRGVGGVTTPAVANVKEFVLAGVPVHNVEFLVGGSEVGSGSIGVLGQNFLETWDVEYDLAKGMIRLMKVKDCGHTNLAYWVAKDQPFSLMDISQISPLEPHTVGTAYVNGVKINVMFDTGASTSVLSLKAAARAGVKIDSPGVVDGGYSSGIGRGMVKSYIAPFDSFKIGDSEEIKRTKLRIADTDLGYNDMLIGSDFFLSHHIFVSNSQHRLYMTYNGGPVFNLASAQTKRAADGAAVDAAPGQADAGETLDAAALVRRGEASAGRRDFDPALADLSKAVDLEPANAEYLYQRGRILWQKGEGDAALADFNHVLELRADHVPALMSRAEFRIHAKDIPGAAADLDRVDKIVAKPGNVRLELAQAYQAADLLSQAIAQFDAWIAAHPDDAQLPHALNGRCWDRALLGQDLKEALADCDRAVRLSVRGDNAGILDSRGLVRLRLGDYDKAIADYDAALKLNPRIAPALYCRGIAKIRKKQTAAGDADMAEAIKIAPHVAERFQRRGILP